jgi:CBS domain-containing protein
MAMKVKDMMTTTGLVTVRPEDSLELAAQIVLWGGMAHLPVVHDGKVVGMLAEHDIIGHRMTAAGGGLSTVASAMTEPAATVGPEEDVEAAAATMAARGIGCLPVVTEGMLVGVLTSGDILAHQVGRSLRPRAEHAPTVAEMMTPDCATARPGDDLVDAVARMTRLGVRHLPVVDGDGRLVGMLSDRDVRRVVGSPTTAVDHAAGRERVRHFKVADAMTHTPFSAGLDATLAEIGQCLTDRRLGAVPIVDDAGRVLGIVSYVDVIRAILPR